MPRHTLARFTYAAGLGLLAACSGSDAGNAPPPVAPPIEQLVVRIDPKADSLLLGASRTYTASVATVAGVPRSATVDFLSLDPAIATVSNGTVTAVALGQARIVARAGAAADTAALRVYAPTIELRLVPSAVAATLGDTIQFEATIVSGNGENSQVSAATWELSDSSAATVVRAGAITTTAEGALTVVARVGETMASASVTVKAAPVSSIAIVPSNLSLAVGGRGQLVAEQRDSRGRLLSGRDVVWSSSRPEIASVDASGLVTAVAKGGAIVSARAAGGRMASVAVNVTGAAATAVSIVLPNDSLGTGRSMQATAIPVDASGAPILGRPMAWQSSNPSVATVNSGGLIAGITSGQSTISVITDGRIASQRVTVAVPAPHTVMLTPATAVLFTGSATTFGAAVLDQFGTALDGRTINWSSSNPAIASVNSNGQVSAVAAGTVTIRAANAALSSTASVTVQNVPVASVTLAPLAPSLERGTTVALFVTAKDAAGNTLPNRPVSWTSSAPAVATVSSSGVVSGVGAGSATISATVEGHNVQTTATVTEPPPPPISYVTVTLNSTVLTVGQGTSAVARAYDVNGDLVASPISWSSSNPATAAVNASGTVQALSAGSTTIRALAGAIEGLASVTVEPTVLPVAQVLLSAASTALMVGDSTPVSVELRDAQGGVLTGRTVSFSTTSSLVAVVTAGGYVRGTGSGAATVSASSEGKTATLAFTITSAAPPPPPPPPPPPAPVATVTVTLAASSLTVGQGTQGSATLQDAAGTVLTGRTIAWSSSNTSVATVNQSGYVTAVGAGSASISAQSEGKSGNASLAAVAAPAVVKTVTVTLNPTSVLVGATSQATAVARDSAGAVITGRAVTWSVSAGASNASIGGGTSATATATGTAAGSASVAASVDGISGSATLTVTAPPPPPPPPPLPPTAIQLPALPTLINFSYPSVTGRSLVVKAGDNLQTVLNSAVRGDEIVIDAGATFTGNFTLPAKAGTAANGWILIRSSRSAQLPPQGTRVTPTSASLMPKIITPNTMPALKTAAGTSGWWISGVEFSLVQMTHINYGLVAFGDGSPQNTLASVPHDLVLERSYVHGLATSAVSRCVTLNSGRTAVQDSYLFDCHLKGFDSQAILGWNGPGPFKIVNNTLAGAGENIMFGGADPSIPGLIPSDIEVRRNYIYTPASWKGVWTKKNIFELKNAQRVLVAENVLEGSWLDGQTGEAFVLKVSNQSGSCTWCSTLDVTIRNNIVRNAGAGFAIMGQQGGSPHTVGQLLNRLLIEQNVVENINTGFYTGAARLITIMQDAQNVTIRHNTMTAPGSLAQYLNLSSNPAATNFAFQNNIMTHGNYGFFSSWYQVGENNLKGFKGTIAFQNVVMIGAQRSGYPNGQFVSSLAAAQATGFGANSAAVNAATQGVVIP